MNYNDALRIVEVELRSEDGFLFKIAMKKGIDTKAVETTKEAMASLIEYYNDKDLVPKALAACFIDLTPLAERSIGYYSQSEQDQIEDIKNDLISLAEELLE